ncbi:hypothetical protein DL771_006236 [Monosporascus sp. 5C6A]|nr:hypothetical protein DL771_006236 [Monosporascus sp. 5C6A]
MSDNSLTTFRAYKVYPKDRENPHHQCVFYMRETFTPGQYLHFHCTQVVVLSIDSTVENNAQQPYDCIIDSIVQYVYDPKTAPPAAWVRAKAPLLDALGGVIEACTLAENALRCEGLRGRIRLLCLGVFVCPAQHTR